MSKKPTVLMILDGFGLNETSNGNAVAQANTPVLDKMMKDIPLSKDMPVDWRWACRTGRWEIPKSDI